MHIYLCLKGKEKNVSVQPRFVRPFILFILYILFILLFPFNTFIGLHTMIVPSVFSYLYYSKIFLIIKSCDHLEISKINSEADVKYYYLNNVLKGMLKEGQHQKVVNPK